MNWTKKFPEIIDSWLFPKGAVLPTRMIIPFENPHLHDFANWETVLGIPDHNLGVVNVHNLNGIDFGVAKPVLGAAAAAMLIDAATRRGVTTVIGVGFAGGVAPGLKSGDILIACDAMSRDGVADKYVSGDGFIPASGVYLERAMRYVGQFGSVLSVAAAHLEDQPLVDECQILGISAIDMETSVLYAIASLRDTAALSLLTISDIPLTGTTATSSLLSSSQREALEGAVSLLSRDGGSAEEDAEA